MFRIHLRDGSLPLHLIEEGAGRHHSVDERHLAFQRPRRVAPPVDQDGVPLHARGVGRSPETMRKALNGFSLGLERFELCLLGKADVGFELVKGHRDAILPEPPLDKARRLPLSLRARETLPLAERLEVA